MVLLPKGNPVKENVDPGKINLPSALEKLRDSKFSGYLRFDFPQATGLVVFHEGRLLDALLENPLGQVVAQEALAGIFRQSLRGQGRLNVFRLTPELALNISALLHGEVLYREQDVEQVDIGVLLNRIKEGAVSGCVRVAAEDKVVLIFYRDGKPLGFFHDGAGGLETTADPSMSIARLPGAKMEVLATKEPEVTDNLMQSGMLQTLWSKAQSALGKVAGPKPDEEEVKRREASEQAERRQALLLALKNIAARHLGKIGGSLVDKEFEKSLAITITDAGLAVFYDQLGKAAKLIAGPSKIAAMLDEMRQSVKNILTKA